jgi:hypothetical protein
MFLHAKSCRNLNSSEGKLPLALHNHYGFIHTAGVRLVGIIAASLIMLSLSACSQSMRLVPLTTATLAATLDLPLPDTHTPTPSATQALPATELVDTMTLPPLETATQTITPWANDTPTPGPTLKPSITPTVTRTPTITRTPSRTPTITNTPTITFTPTPPAPANQIIRPGLMSKVVSPIQVEIYAVTGEGGKITIELVGEDGRVISRQVINRGSEAGRRVWLAQQLPFEIQAAAETARLQVITYDAFGREVFLSSADLILLSVGRNEPNPSALIQAPYLIRRPAADEVVSGGLLVIEALARPVNDSPLLIELVRETGRPLVVKQFVVPAPTGELSHTPFIIEIPYRVSQTTPIRLVFRQEGSRIPGTVALWSRLIILEP